MLTILKAGLYTTVQDGGRHFGANLGISVSGAMDRQSAHMTNQILGNNANDALLECTLIGPIITFHSDTYIAITGAVIPAFINNSQINTFDYIQIQADDVLSFGKLEKGCRFYVGIKNGIQSDIVFNSRSVCITSNILQLLKKGDQLTYKPSSEPPDSTVSLNRILGNTNFQVYKGPEFSILKKLHQEKLFDTVFTILPTSNRMAYRVCHSTDLSHAHFILSSGTIPGTIQLTPSGDIICLMRDAQTTGGYPRILQLSEESICDLSQLSPNEKFTFQLR